MAKKLGCKIYYKSHHNPTRMQEKPIAIGQRISTRGEDFLITNIINNSDGSQLLDVEGISELVKGMRFAFDTKIDNQIKAVDPNDIVFIADTEAGYRKSKLYILHSIT